MLGIISQKLISNCVVQLWPWQAAEEDNRWREEEKWKVKEDDKWQEMEKWRQTEEAARQKEMEAARKEAAAKAKVSFSPTT